jgi:hypothetical protein
LKSLCKLRKLTETQVEFAQLTQDSVKALLALILHTLICFKVSAEKRHYPIFTGTYHGFCLNYVKNRCNIRIKPKLGIIYVFELLIPPNQTLLLLAQNPTKQLALLLTVCEENKSSGSPNLPLEASEYWARLRPLLLRTAMSTTRFDEIYGSMVTVESFTCMFPLIVKCLLCTLRNVTVK